MQDEPINAGGPTARRIVRTQRTRNTPSADCAMRPPQSAGPVWPDLAAPADDVPGVPPALLLELFGQTPIVFHRLYIDITGSVGAALWLAYAVYHVSERGTDANGWFVKSQTEWQLDTGLSRREQESARFRLRLLGILEEARQPNAPLAFRLCMERLYGLMQTHAERLNAERLAARSAQN